MSLRVVITGGAGFVGSNLAVGLRERHPDWQVMAADNLYRRGSELNLPRLRAAGVRFAHADVRDRHDLEALGDPDALVECSAEPSVMAGVDGATRQVFDTNLVGAYHCIDFAARRRAQLIFLSTSRVYPIAPLTGLVLEEMPTRFELAAEQVIAGASVRGISEGFPLAGARTLYGATKLAAELLIAEYAASHGLCAVVDRFGVIAGPWQMGKVDQGVFTYWLFCHHLGRPLTYVGFGGSGKQVRDLLHVQDAIDLVEAQLLDPDAWAGATVNVGGGRERSLSLREATALCREITGRSVPITEVVETRPGDVPLYISDCTALYERTSWRPRRDPLAVLTDTYEWIESNERLVVGAI
jgi:CDP-paratose 2-epimerase